ncbi:5'-nucleotidase domain-containing protein 3 [Bagarius yarrelli]|uniref:5'-nucleotidase domain-containing protein 3 n=1 Tax=Bagarius yarrelli TaxID=175774 RepID=A0A556V0L7_BAGYA|nr:5'-nucleotidase domain-containing protein 3 [Bagarius yarrelli]
MSALSLPLSRLSSTRSSVRKLFKHCQTLYMACGAPGLSSSGVSCPPVPGRTLSAAGMCTSHPGGKSTDWLWSVYNETKRQTQALIPAISNNVNPDTIFANNEMSLQDIEIYGFDYDYTLAFYSSHLHTLIFDVARDILIQQHRYPEGLKDYNYIPNFVIRGLHYDVQKSSHGHSMKQFMDIFSLPEMTLLSCVNDYFMKHNIDYEPVHLYKDVKTHAVLKKLSANGKKMFLITNSPLDFVDRGMNYIIGKDWRDLFDVVIVQADKPGFFNDRRKPFRRVTDKGVLLWDRIHHLEKGQIYKQDLTLKHGWRTGAIIPELRKEIKIMNAEEYVHTMTWLQSLTSLVEQMQVHRDAASQSVVQQWIREREDMRSQAKNMFNSQFGSLFRTYHNPTYFSRRLSRFADIYMASLSCLLNYDLQHTFYPRRTPLQHEVPFWPEQANAGTVTNPIQNHCTRSD